VYSGYILIRVEWIALCPWRPTTNMDNSQGNHIVKVDGHPAWHCHQGISFFPILSSRWTGGDPPV